MHQLKLGTYFHFEPLRKFTFKKTNLALQNQIQTWHKVPSKAHDNCFIVEIWFVAPAETWHKCYLWAPKKNQNSTKQLNWIRAQQKAQTKTPERIFGFDFFCIRWNLEQILILSPEEKSTFYETNLALPYQIQTW